MTLTIIPVASLSAQGRAKHRRRAQYHASLKSALPHIEEAVAAGCKTAAAVAVFLNTRGVPAPSGGKWSLFAVLRARKRLKALGLHPGSPHFSKAREYPRGPRPSLAERRARMIQALARLEARVTATAQCKGMRKG